MAEQANTNQEESSEKLSKTKKQESTNADGMNGKVIENWMKIISCGKMRYWI